MVFNISTVNPFRPFSLSSSGTKMCICQVSGELSLVLSHGYVSNVILLPFFTLYPCSQILVPFSVSPGFLMWAILSAFSGWVEIFYSGIFKRMQGRCPSYTPPCFGPQDYSIWPLFFNLSSLVNSTGKVLKAIRHFRVRAAPQSLNHFESCNLLSRQYDERNDRW